MTFPLTTVLFLVSNQQQRSQFLTFTMYLAIMKED